MTTKNQRLHELVKGAITGQLYSFNDAKARRNVFAKKVSALAETLLHPHLSRTAKNYQFNVIAKDAVSVGTLGHISFGGSFEGKLVANSDDVLAFKLTGNKFMVAEKSVFEKPELFEGQIGKKFEVKPYSPKFIDGHPTSEARRNADGSTVYTIGGSTKINEGIEYGVIKSPYLLEMIDQINNLIMPDGMRFISCALVDAGLRKEGFTYIDVDADSAGDKKPTLTFKLENQTISLAYDFGYDTYDLLVNDELVMEGGDNFTFECLADAFNALINDDAWKYPKVTTEKELKALKKAA
ncbi:MAG: hypothetical protein ACTS9Y_00345 [Methylophilus sp.]|uniref:hypothetical protein n=1 Tax=Methylophilus sp. TaxID=29541 RepID=UPI003FA030B2